MAGALTAAIAAAFSGVTADPYFEYTTLLLPGSGTNGTQNNSFVDSSANAFPITRNPLTGPNAPTQGTFSPFSQTGWGNYFDGTGDNLVLPSSSNLAFGTGDFCVEAWVYWTATGVLDAIYSNATNSAGGDTQFSFILTPTNKVQVEGWSAIFLTGATSVVSNTWNHIVVCRSGTTLSIFLNGTRDATTTTSNNWSSTNAFYIGDYPVGGSAFSGYISNLRVVKGSTPYDATSSSLTVPTAPLTAITNTQLLTCQSNRFKDNSTNNFTITRNGDTRVVAFSPFNPTASWSAATYGGSGYFDGSGDYLSIADNDAFALGSNDWTIECWVYVSSLSAQGFIAQVASNGADSTLGFILGINASGYPYVASYINGAYTAATASTAIVTNQWNHIAGSRASGTMGVFLNGSRLASTAVSGSSVNSTATVTVGASQSGSSALTTGYIANARIVNGTAVYSGTTYTVPTAPLTAITNTSLLLNFTNAGIYDATSKNDLETVADAQISNTTAKWGSTSIKFDGTGDWLDALASNQLFNLSSGDWTIEAWIYRNASGAAHTILSLYNTAASNSGLTFYVNASNQLVTDNGVTAALAAGTVASGQWVYVAIVRSGSTTTGYINGSSVGTTAQAPSASQYARVGALATGASAFNGYIQDLRITKGYARTIATPTAAFPTL